MCKKSRFTWGYSALLAVLLLAGAVQAGTMTIVDLPAKGTLCHDSL